MNVLVLSGLGPTIKNANLLAGTFLDGSGAPHPRASALAYVGPGGPYRLLRPRRGGMPHLTTATLRAIITGGGRDATFVPLEDVWADRPPPAGDHDVVLLSTTFICNRPTLARAVGWVTRHLPGTMLVVGGQYANLKYRAILRELPAVDVVARGDGEAVIPALLEALERGGDDLAGIPNLVYRQGDEIVETPHRYIDLEREPSPVLAGTHPVVPYESMRGCPFTCKFCSFPFASPEWRVKSSRKICDDWRRYRDDNGARLIKAMDSTFTIPPTRFAELLEALPEVGIAWEAYSRANVIRDAATVDALAAAGCVTLSIGFESMSDASLRRMHKQVTRAQNQRCSELLAGSAVDLRASFMIGYPGDTLEDHEATHRFLVDDFAGRFLLSVFSLGDETMPVWQDAERVNLRVFGADDEVQRWEHIGMDSVAAEVAHRRTLREVRWGSERAVLLLWQMQYEMPLVPHLPLAAEYRVEKLIERLAFAAEDHASDPARAAWLERSLLEELAGLGVRPLPVAPVAREGARA